jgi:hypothetical protein
MIILILWAALFNKKPMAINKNHEFEELDGVKCSIVEKNASPERVAFLKGLLEFNNYTVVVVESPPPKTAVSPKPAATVTAENGEPVAPLQAEVLPPAPTTFTVGVTDVRFNATNAVFGRMLKTRDGRVVTLAYWQEEEAVANDEVPYFGKV